MEFYNFLILWINLHCFISTVSASFLTSKLSEDEFLISFRGIDLMLHTRENPILTLGFGSFQATENAGNFELTDEVTDYEDFEPGPAVYG